jgi:Tfp pilus assembly protein PilN
MPNVEGQVGQSVASSVMPRVNLMPPEIAEAARFRRFQLAMAGAVAAAVVVVGLLYTHEHSGVTSAKSELDAAKQQNVALQSQLTSLQSVQDVYSQVASAEAMLQQAMGGEIRWSSYLADLSLRIPDHVWLTNVTATQTVTGLTVTTATTTPGAVTSGGIGNIAFQGVAFSHDDVATWLDMLAKERGFTNPYFTSSTEGTIGPKTVDNFASTVDITPQAESGRYNKPAGS